MSIVNLSKLIFMAFVVFIFNCSAAENYNVSVYSDMRHNSVEGEFFGLEICLFRSPEGLQAAWRLGNGRMERTLLLDVTELDDRRFVDVPNVIDGAGRWRLIISERNIVAMGPKQQKFKLNRVELLPSK